MPLVSKTTNSTYYFRGKTWIMNQWDMNKCLRFVVFLIESDNLSDGNFQWFSTFKRIDVWNPTKCFIFHSFFLNREKEKEKKTQDTKESRSIDCLRYHFVILIICKEDCKFLEFSMGFMKRATKPKKKTAAKVPTTNRNQTKNIQPLASLRFGNAGKTICDCCVVSKSIKCAKRILNGFVILLLVIFLFVSLRRSRRKRRIGRMVRFDFFF